MSSRLTRTLLKLYPRRIRHRYGDELLDLEDELRAQGELSRTRLIRDMLVGALVIQPTRRRARLLTGAVLLVAGVAVAGAIIGGHGSERPARHPRPRAVAVVIPVLPVPESPFRDHTCLIAADSSCSLTACTEFVGRTPVGTGNSVAVAVAANAHSSAPTAVRAPRATTPRCPASDAAPQNGAVVARPASTG